MNELGGVNEYLDRDGVTWPSYEDYIFVGLLGYCGCYDDELFSDVLAVFKAFDEGCCYYTDIRVEGPPRYKELILHDLTRAGLLEHGTSVRASWLTDAGRRVLAELGSRAKVAREG